MNNTKSLIVKERVRFTWAIMWLVLIVASIPVYMSKPLLLSIDDGLSFWDWTLKLLSPHNWLGLASVLLALYGARAIWRICEQKWPIIKDFQFVPVAIIITVLLLWIGTHF